MSASFNTNRNHRAINDRIDDKPVFSVNPSILLTMNDEMAQEIITALEDVIQLGGRLPPSVFAFKQTLKSDLARH